MVHRTMEEYGTSFIEEKIPLVVRIAGKVHRRLPPCVAKDDLVSAGMIGLLHAIDRFNPSAGAEFDTYAEYRIRGEMLDELRRMDCVPRSIRDKVNRARRLCESYAETKEGFPEMEEMTSINESFVYNRNVAPEECVSGEEDSFELLSKEETRISIAKMLDELAPAEKAVIMLVYYEELSMTRAGELMGLSVSRISQIHKGILSKLRQRHRESLP